MERSPLSPLTVIDRKITAIATQEVKGEMPPLRQAIEALQPIAAEIILAILLSGAVFVGDRLRKAREDRQRSKELPEVLPIRERKRVQDLLAQAAVLVKADRVMLGILHGGSLNPINLEYDMLAIPYCYQHPSMPPLPEAYRDVPLSQIKYGLEYVWDAPDREYVGRLSACSPPCRFYMERRGLEQVVLRARGNSKFDTILMGYHWRDEGEWGKEQREAINAIEEELIEIAKLATFSRVVPLWLRSKLI